MKHLRYLALVMVLVPGFLSAQEATITIDGYGYGAIAGIGHECPIRQVGDRWRIDGYEGMQVSCPVWGMDSDGNFTPASVTVSVSDSSRVSALTIHSVQDTLGQFYPDTLKIQILRRGNWQMNIDANPLLFTMGFAYTRSPDAVYPQHEYPPITVVLNEVFALCAYEGGYEDAVAKSYNRPTPCPDLGDHALPEFEVEWILPDILGFVDPGAVPGSVMAQLDQQPDLLRVRHLTKTLHSVPLKAVATIQ